MGRARFAMPQVLAGRYELGDPLGLGGMSVVWRARDRVLERDVAVKMLTMPRENIDMRAEALAAAKVVHPHVAAVYDYVEAEVDGTPTGYIVMELLEGSRLSQVPMPLPAVRALQICAEVASALAAAHAKDVVHRDVKPGNVMLTDDGVKVIDFGLAARIGSSEMDGQNGSLIGTPNYVAPERLAGGPVTAATDVYALGVMLYRLLTGDYPWSPASPGERLLSHLSDEPLPLPPLHDLPDDVCVLYRRALAKQPDARPTARELAVALAAAAQEPMPAAREPIPVGAGAPAIVSAAPIASAEGPTNALSLFAGGPSAAQRRPVVLGVAALLLTVGAGGALATTLFVSSMAPPTGVLAQIGPRPPVRPMPSTATRPADASTSAGDPDAASAGTPVMLPPGVLPPGDLAPAVPPVLLPSPGSSTGVMTSTAAPTSHAPDGGPPAGPPTTSPTPSPGPTAASFTTAAGTVVAVCAGDQAQLTSWSANPMFRVDAVSPGPATIVAVRFRHGNDVSLVMVTCVDGSPAMSTGPV